MGVELTVGQLLSGPTPRISAGSAARCAAADQRSALPGCVHAARMGAAHDPLGWTNHPRSMGVELTVGQLLFDPAPCKSAGDAARHAAADQRSALPGMCPCGVDGRRPRSIRMDESPAVHGGRADRWSAALRSTPRIGRILRAVRRSRPTVGSTGVGPCGVDRHRPRSTRMDESPAVHEGRADRWSAALLSDTAPFGRIRRAVHGSRPTVGSTGGDHSAGSAARCTAADQRSALPGVRPWGSAGCIATDQRSALPGWEVLGGPAAPRVGVLTNRLRQTGTDRVGEDVGGLAAQVVVLA